MTDQQQPKLKRLVLWVPAEDYSALEQLASQQYRPVVHQASLLLRTALENAGLLKQNNRVELVHQ